MNKYENGKIYKISNGELTYYGSTIQPLWQRRGTHKKYKNCKSSLIENGVLTLVEDFPCSSKEELLWKERWYIENNICVNTKKPILTDEERIQYKKDKAYRNNKKKYFCETCKVELTRNYKNKHENSVKHLKLLENNL